MIKPNYTIGIDPDTHKSGVAIYCFEYGTFDLFELTLWDLFNFLLENSARNPTIRLECGHKDKSTWHKGGNAMAKKVGANHEIGRQIEKFCLEKDINIELVKPCGFSSYTHQSFCGITGWPIKIKTNPEKRVAGLLCYKR